eukprot:12146909-Alexandrium_andersonii.AAC.1
MFARRFRICRRTRGSRGSEVAKPRNPDSSPLVSISKQANSVTTHPELPRLSRRPTLVARRSRPL